MKRFALRLTFIVRYTATRNWPIRKSINLNSMLALILNLKVSLAKIRKESNLTSAWSTDLGELNLGS